MTNKTKTKPEITSFDTFLEKIKDFFRMTIRYDCDIDYETSNSCEESGCEEEGICRCGEINDIVINSINFTKITKNFINHISKIACIQEEKPIWLYCLDRLFKLVVIDKGKEAIYARGESDYYGEELEVNLAPNLLSTFIDRVKELRHKAPHDKIVYLLNLEYSYLTPQIANLENDRLILKQVELDQINMVTSLKKIPSFNLVDNDELPKGILIQIKPNVYNIIDGHHRFALLKQKNVLKAPYLIYNYSEED